MSGALGTNLLNVLSSKSVGATSSITSDTQSSADSSTGSDFLSTLLGAIDETNEFLPERMQISEKEIYQEFLAKIEQNAFGGFGVGFNESDKGNIFENLSFMQVLGVLENMQIQSTDVKLANLSTQMQDLLQTESNLSALKNVSNIDELLSLAKDLNLNVSKIKVDTLLEMKEVFPNLNKNNFFTSKLDGIFKDLINQKIATITKDLPTNSHKNSQIKSESNILSKTFADLEKQSKNIKNENPTSKLFASVSDEAKNIKTTLNDDTNLNTQTKQNLPLDTALKQTQEKAILPENEGLNEAHKKANLGANSQEKDEPSKVQNLNENKISNKLQSQDESPLPSKEMSKEIFKEPSKELNLKENKQENVNLNQNKVNVNQANENAKQVATPQNSANILQNTPLRQESVNSALKTEPNKKEAKNEGKFTQSILSENKTQSKENLATNVSNQALQNKSVANEFLHQNKTSENSQNLNNLTQNSLNSQSLNTATSNLQNNLTPNASANLGTNVNANLGTNSNVSSNATFLQSLLDQALRNDETTKNSATTQEANSQNISNEFDTPTGELNSLVRNLSQTLQNENKNNVTTQQTLNYFSQDLKEQMQQFKAPITRLNITLNPSNLGEVEVTLIQRGNNLHINFNSNTNAMNLFIQNQAEFKNSLVNMGFTGLEMNFSDQSKKEQQQKRQRNSSENFEQEQGFLSTNNESLEIVVPKYF